MRYPFAALAGAMGLSEAAACRVLRVSGSSAELYRREGLSHKVADRRAVQAGLHPYEVWPEMADHDLAAARAVVAARARRWRRTLRGRESSRRSSRKHAAETAAYRRRALQVWRDANRDRKREQDRRDWQRHGDARNAARRERYRSDPAYRESVLEKQRGRDRARAAVRAGGNSERRVA